MDQSFKTLDNLRRLILVVAGLCGLTGLLIEYGTYAGPTALSAAHDLSVAAVLLFLVEQILRWRQLHSFRHYFKERWPGFLLSVLLLVEMVVLLVGLEAGWLPQLTERLAAGSITRIYLIVVQFHLLAIFATELPHLHGRFASRRVRPAVAFVLAFVGLIVLGTGLLLLPRATPPDQAISVLDALFTSTSAVCVTGLIVRDTGTGFTTFGQTVILVLIQLGGLGIMSLTAALSLLLGRGIGVRESSLLREVFQVPMLAAVGRTVRTIIIMTLTLEAVGAVLLYVGFAGVFVGHRQRLFAAVFHAVSAFCNAGFSTFSDSLVSLSDRPLVMGTAAGLLTIGGLGFGVLVQVLAWLRGRALGRGRRDGRLSLNTRVVLAVSLLLTVIGTGFLLTLEWNGALAGLDGWHRLGQAFFQSATCRTAGFNSLDLTVLSPAALFLMIILMFIGGAPGSTAGGVKVTAVAVVWANLRSVGAGSSRVRLGDRELEAVQVHRAMLVLTSGLIVAAVSVFVLLAVEQMPMMAVVFEAFSALGTVGLSLGVTPDLSAAGRLIVIVLMFIGRLGPLTLTSSLTGAAHEPRIRRPRGRIMIG